MPGIGTDVLEGARHNERFRYDLGLVREPGIRTVRYPPHGITSKADPPSSTGRYWAENWTRSRNSNSNRSSIWCIIRRCPMSFSRMALRRATSRSGLRNSRSFCMERYPWVTQYTLFNEPYLTAQFCGEFGIWFPFRSGGPSFVAMLLNVTRYRHGRNDAARKAARCSFDKSGVGLNRPLHSRTAYLTFTSSTSNTSVLFAGILAPCACAP